MTDFRALCAELVDALAEQDRCWMLINDARAALAQPEPTPTDEELLNEVEEMAEEYGRPSYWLDGEPDYYLAIWARRVLARWGKA